MTWFLTMQGFFFAALAFAWEKSVGLIVVLSILGTLSSFSTGVLLRLGILTMKSLEKKAPKDDPRPVIGRGYEETSAALHLVLPWHLFPILFMVAWTALIMIRVWNGSLHP
jgi:hypothetical protein